MKNVNEDQKSRYFTTSNFYVAAFLFVKELELVNVDKITDSKRAQFVFLDTPDREFWIHCFNFAKEDGPETMVDARKLITAIKMLKDTLYQDKF